MTPDPKGQIVNALPDQVTEVLREHVWFNSEECVAIGPVSDAHCRCGHKGGVKSWAAHVAEQITDLLLDLAGTGQLLASIDRIAR